MSKTAITGTELGLPAAVIAHAYLRLRGDQTAELTVLQAATAGARVNLEVDLIGKYVEKLVAPQSNLMTKLKEHGYVDE